jgi:hypothetical protein
MIIDAGSKLLVNQSVFSGMFSKDVFAYNLIWRRLVLLRAAHG